GIEVDDVAPLPRRHADPAPLPDREAGDAVVAPEDGAVAVDDRTGPRAGARGHELLAVAPGDEADVHALGLRRRAQAKARGVLAHLGLRELAHREQGSGELGLAEHV